MSWILGMFAYCTQMSLGVLVLLDQASQSNEGTPFNIPVRITNEVRVGQFFNTHIYFISEGYSYLSPEYECATLP